jgi:hypothetical protein
MEFFRGDHHRDDSGPGGVLAESGLPAGPVIAEVLEKGNLKQVQGVLRASSTFS